MCRRTEEVGSTVGLLRHILLVGFFYVQIQAPTQDQPFYGYSEKPPLYDVYGNTEDLFSS